MPGIARSATTTRKKAELKKPDDETQRALRASVTRSKFLESEIEEQRKAKATAVGQIRAEKFEVEAKHAVEILKERRIQANLEKEIASLKEQLAQTDQDNKYLQDKINDQSHEMANLKKFNRECTASIRKLQESTDEKKKQRMQRELDRFRHQLGQTRRISTSYAKVLQVVTINSFIKTFKTRGALRDAVKVVDSIIAELQSLEVNEDKYAVVPASASGMSNELYASRRKKRLESLSSKRCMTVCKALSEALSHLKPMADNLVKILIQARRTNEGLAERNVQLTAENKAKSMQLKMHKKSADASAKGLSENSQTLDKLMDKHKELEAAHKEMKYELNRKLRQKDKELLKKSLLKRKMGEQAVILPHLEAGIALVEKSSMHSNEDVTTILTTVYTKNIPSLLTPGGISPTMSRIQESDKEKAINSLWKRNQEIIHQLTELHTLPEDLSELGHAVAKTHAAHMDAKDLQSKREVVTHLMPLDRSAYNTHPDPRARRAPRPGSSPGSPVLRSGGGLGRVYGNPSKKPNARSRKRSDLSLGSLENRLLATLPSGALQPRPLSSSMSSPSLFLGGARIRRVDRATN